MSNKKITHVYVVSSGYGRYAVESDRKLTAQQAFERALPRFEDAGGSLGFMVEVIEYSPSTMMHPSTSYIDTQQYLENAGRGVEGKKEPHNQENKTMTEFARSFNLLSKRIHDTAIEKGWWDEERNDGELIALCHSELSEALEALRAGNPPDDKVSEFSGAESELADCIIRIMDMASARGWRVAEALESKIAFNETRTRKHGGKLF